jgi:hypothetical protein
VALEFLLLQVFDENDEVTVFGPVVWPACRPACTAPPGPDLWGSAVGRANTDRTCPGGCRPGGLRVGDIGLWELNEAFAWQALHCRDTLTEE